MPNFETTTFSIQDFSKFRISVEVAVVAAVAVVVELASVTLERSSGPSPFFRTVHRILRSMRATSTARLPTRFNGIQNREWRFRETLVEVNGLFLHPTRNK